MSMSSDSVARWRKIVRDQSRSGLSVAAYCRRARVPQSSFYAWRRKLHRDAVTFAEVSVKREPMENRESRPALELRLPGERGIWVRPGFDRQTLRDLLAALETDA